MAADTDKTWPQHNDMKDVLVKDDEARLEQTTAASTQASVEDINKEIAMKVSHRVTLKRSPMFTLSAWKKSRFADHRIPSQDVPTSAERSYTQNLERELKLIASAYHDLAGRLQMNNVVLQRRAEAPKSWLGKQRKAMEGVGGLVR